MAGMVDIKMPENTDSTDELIYDWNRADTYAPRPQRKIEFDDETLRDGLQSPAVTNPAIEKKIEILHLMDQIGVHTANLGLPGAGPFHMNHIEALAKEIRDAKLGIQANVACRTMVTDVEPVVGLVQRLGMPVEVCCFIGSSRIRSYTEDWSLDRMLKATENCLTFCRDNDLPVMYVTEDTSRAHPETLEKLYGMAIDLGADRLCFCDTCGHSTPDGVRALIRWAASVQCMLPKKYGHSGTARSASRRSNVRMSSRSAISVTIRWGRSRSNRSVSSSDTAPGK